MQSEFGAEAKDVGGRLAESAGNVSCAAGQVASVGTGGPIAAAAARGAVAEENRTQEEMGTFKIQGREEGGEWKEVPV